MAKKRTSLKGKLTGSGESEEKGKGIDLLFGGTPEDTDDEAADDPAASDSASETVVPAPPAPSSAAAPPPPAPAFAGPTGAAESEDIIDPDALPVALEAPPAEAEVFIDPEALPVALEAPPAGEEPIIDPDALPVAMEAPPPDEAPAIDPDALPVAMEEPDLGAGLEISMDDITAPPDPAVGAPDLAVDPVSPDIVPPVSPEPVPVIDPAADIPDIGGEADIVDGGAGDLGGIEPGPAIEPAPSPYQPPVDPVPPVDYAPIPGPDTSAPPVDPTPIPPPPSPSISPPRGRIEGFSGIVTEKIQVVEKDILPEDTKFGGGPVSNVLTLSERAQVEQNELITQKVTRYIGRERREKLDKDIEALYDEVAAELSGKEDAEFALRTLSKAQDIIFEDARQYDEALYRVAVVRWMIGQKRNHRRWASTWGVATFFYAIIWIGLLVTGILFTGEIGARLDSVSTVTTSVLVARQAWFSALAGGIGGAIGILYSLYWHVSKKQDFLPVSTMYYAVMPVMGFILGAVLHFIIGAGFLVIDLSIEPTSDLQGATNQVQSSLLVISFQLVSGFLAGFRMRFVLELLDKIVQRFSSPPDNQDTSGSSAAAMAPPDTLPAVLPPGEQ